MTLIVVLVVMGAGYCLLTSAPKPVRQFELTAVWATLALIGAALLSSVDPAISLLLAGLVIAPLWYVTLYMCDQYARTESENTAQLWRHWRATFGNRRNPDAQTGPAAASLATRLDTVSTGHNVEEIEMTQLPVERRAPKSAAAATRNNWELAPVERIQHRRGRIV